MKDKKMLLQAQNISEIDVLIEAAQWLHLNGWKLARISLAGWARN
jgi:hypothetical protein